MDAVAASLAVGTRKRAGRRSAKNGKFLRDGAVIERERRALELLRDSRTHSEIAQEMGISRSAASNLIQRALAHRAEREGLAVEEARTIHVMRLEKLLGRYMPRALGDYLDMETGETEHVPDVRAGEFVLKVLNQLADVQGTKKTPIAPPSSGTPDTSGGGLHVHFHHPAERQKAEATILQTLAVAAQKTREVEGQLAAIGTSTAALTGQVVEDKPGPPPVRT